MFSFFKRSKSQKTTEPKKTKNEKNKNSQPNTAPQPPNTTTTNGGGCSAKTTRIENDLLRRDDISDRQYQNESVGECTSKPNPKTTTSAANRIIEIMAKGRNRRNNSKKNKPYSGNNNEKQNNTVLEQVLPPPGINNKFNSPNHQPQQQENCENVTESSEINTRVTNSLSEQNNDPNCVNVDGAQIINCVGGGVAIENRTPNGISANSPPSDHENHHDREEDDDEKRNSKIIANDDENTSTKVNEANSLATTVSAPTTDHADFVRQLVLDKYKRTLSPQRNNNNSLKFEETTNSNCNDSVNIAPVVEVENTISHTDESAHFGVDIVMGQPSSKTSALNNRQQQQQPSPPKALQQQQLQTQHQQQHQPSVLEDEKDIFYEATAEDVEIPDINQLLDYNHNTVVVSELNKNQPNLSPLTDHHPPSDVLVIHPKVGDDGSDLETDNSSGSYIEEIIEEEVEYDEDEDDEIVEEVEEEEEEEVEKMEIEKEHTSAADNHQQTQPPPINSVNNNNKSNNENNLVLNLNDNESANDNDDDDDVEIESVDTSDDNNSDDVINMETNTNSIIEIDENQLLADLRNELKEIKSHHRQQLIKQNSSDSNQESTLCDKNNLTNSAFNLVKCEKSLTVNSDDDLKAAALKKKSIIRLREHVRKEGHKKKRVTFLEGLISLPDVVESTTTNHQQYHGLNSDGEEEEDDDDDDEEDGSDEENTEEESSSEEEVEEESESVSSTESHNGVVIQEIDGDEAADHPHDEDYFVEENSTSVEINGEEKDTLNILDGGDGAVGGGIGTVVALHQNDIKSREDDNNSLDGFDMTEDSGVEVEINQDKRDLVNQEERYNVHLDDFEKQAITAQLKIEALERQIDTLEKEHSVKTWNIERLQAELSAACKEGECVRQRLRQREVQMDNIRGKSNDLEDEMSRKYDELDTTHKAMVERFNEIKTFCSSLQMQLASTSSEIEALKLEKQKLIDERAEEQIAMQKARDAAQQEKTDLEVKWKKEFEQLRNCNAEREEHLLEDCEWQVRNMQKIGKEKLEKVEKEKQEALARAVELEKDIMAKASEFEHLKSCEVEVKQLRGLSNEQQSSIQSLAAQIEELKVEVQTATDRAEQEIENMKKMKWKCDSAIYDNQRYTQEKIQFETMAIACQWEEKLHLEMSRLTNELNQINGEERQEAVEKIRHDYTQDIEQMREKYDKVQAQLKDEVQTLKKSLSAKHRELEEVQESADSQVVQTRMYLEKRENDHQDAMDKAAAEREQALLDLQDEHEREKEDLEEQFCERLEHVKDEFAVEITHATDELKIKHNKALEIQKQKLLVEKTEALQSMEHRYRKKVEDLENKLREQQVSNERLLDDTKSNHKVERQILEQRDHANNKEIENLHRKCRCLTNLFEEMRMRYERRDPRPEDLREISELKDRIDQQERDLHKLTERLREYQLTDQSTLNGMQPPKLVKIKRKASHPAEKIVKHRPDVIMEEVELESQSQQEDASSIAVTQHNGQGES